MLSRDLLEPCRHSVAKSRKTRSSHVPSTAQHYPERLAALWLVDLPTGVSSALQAVAKALPPSTRAKLRCCTASDPRLPITVEKLDAYAATTAPVRASLDDLACYALLAVLFVMTVTHVTLPEQKSCEPVSRFYRGAWVCMVHGSNNAVIGSMPVSDCLPSESLRTVSGS